MSNRIEIKKIDLEAFIETLVTMYDSGVDYVNMIVEKGERQDSIWIDGNNSSNAVTQSEKEDVVIDFEDLA